MQPSLLWVVSEKAENFDFFILINKIHNSFDFLEDVNLMPYFAQDAKKQFREQDAENSEEACGCCGNIYLSEVFKL